MTLKRFELPVVLSIIIAGGSFVIGQSPAKFIPNYDESKVPPYDLPPILKSNSGDVASNIRAWQTRRAELLAVFTDQMFGSQPPDSAKLSWKIVEQGDAFDGLARRRQVEVTLSTDAGSQTIDLLLMTPKGASGPVPAFLGLNFGGNHTTTMDPQVRLPRSWVRNDNATGITDNRPQEKSRGSQEGRWPHEMIVRSGIGVATAYYGDIDPDFDDGFANGVHALFPNHKPDKSHGDRWGTIAAWAWGLSRLLDVLEQLPAEGGGKVIDGTKVAVIGHSRLGKTALWAGATDTRFAAVISNNSGCGGAALSRRAFGETVERINTSFPHWFCGNFHRYNLRENELPIDQHQLLALAAPRPLYVASATEDQWADPRGEFLSTLAAGSLYVALGKEPFGLTEFPKGNQASIGTVSYHLRQGNHDIGKWDWERYIQFLKQQLH